MGQWAGMRWDGVGSGGDGMGGIFFARRIAVARAYDSTMEDPTRKTRRRCTQQDIDETRLLTNEDLLRTGRQTGEQAARLLIIAHDTSCAVYCI